MDNVRFVYFNSPVQIQDKNALKLRHIVSNDRAELVLDKDFLTVTVDGFVTVIPIHNISSIILGE